MGPEPAADQPVLAVHGPAAARQPRGEPVLRRLGAEPDPDPHTAHAVADHLLVRPRRADQRAAGDNRGQPQGRRPRPRGPRGPADRPRHAPVLAGVPADLRVRDQVPLVSGQRVGHGLLRPPAVDVPAQPDRGAGARTGGHPQPARQHAQRARRGVRDHRPVQRNRGKAAVPPARAAKRGHPGGHCARHQHRIPDRWHGDHRERLRHPGPRPAPDQLDLPAGLHRGSGDHAGVRHHGHPAQPGGRHRLRGPRPKSAVQPVSAIPLSPEPGLPGAVPPSAAAPGARAERREGQRVRRWYNQPALMIGIGITAIVLAAAIAGPLISPYDPNAQNLNATLLGPSAHHLLGTDQLGRDVFTRLLYGTRLDLRIACLAVLFPFTLGTILGSVAGYFGGWVDTVIMRVVDVVVAFPFYVLLIALVFVLGPGERSIYIAITLVGWVSYARIIRGEILVAKRQDYILAAQSGGLGNIRIMRRHLLPNVISQAIIYSMSDIVHDILAVVTLGYSGLGVPPPPADLGSMTHHGQNFLTTHWQLTTFPGLAVVLV